MKTPLAWRNLCHNKARTAVAIIGISFAILMIFLQLGFYGSVKNTATSVYDRLDFDILLVSPNYQWIGRPSTLTRRRLYQALSVPEVVKAIPVYIKQNRWLNPETKRKRSILIIGYNIYDHPFNLSEIYGFSKSLQEPYTVLIDKQSQSTIGPIDIGLATEVNHKKIKIVGHFSLGIGFVADGAVILNDQNFVRLFEGSTLDYASLGLISVEDGADLKGVIETLSNILPPDVQILTRKEIEAKEFQYWLKVTATGPIFGAGVLVAFIVGMVVLYQVLSNEISNNLSEYATLKAFGYEDKHLSNIVLQQGFYLAVLGYLPAFGLSFALYNVTRDATHLPIYMTFTRAVFVFGLTVLMCSISGLLSLKRVKKADPADLF